GELHRTYAYCYCKQKPFDTMLRRIVGSEMCIRRRIYTLAGKDLSLLMQWLMFVVFSRKHAGK
ncbi:hypothetical protein, partial [Escherichia coli]|uniref:hypothetical protein n=1 Tax=Escherichia coli TaxID=562 RepID=UPI001BFDC9E6